MWGIPDTVIRRLSAYLRVLSKLVEEGVDSIPSEELGRLSGYPGVLVRKDLTYFGRFGIRGVGYKTRDLKIRLSKILGTDRRWKVAIVGVGHLGAALIAFERFKEHGFDVIAAFDVDERKVGQVYSGVEIKSMSELERVIKEEGIRIGIITVPAQSAQKVADELVKAGVEAILNFAPVNLKVPEDIVLRNVDLSMELETISFFLTNKELRHAGLLYQLGKFRGASGEVKGETRALHTAGAGGKATL